LTTSPQPMPDPTVTRANESAPAPSPNQCSAVVSAHLGTGQTVVGDGPHPGGEVADHADELVAGQLDPDEELPVRAHRQGGRRAAGAGAGALGRGVLGQVAPRPSGGHPDARRLPGVAGALRRRADLGRRQG
jgi:hypothetical protein